jgi:transcriptional regulator with XRE-family HTH domain
MNQARKRIPTPVRRKPAVKAVPGAPVPLQKPNVDDPLSEPTRHRRLWAAYLAAGLTRREFAERLGTNYHTVNRWDAGAATISLDMLERASALVRFTMDELCFGRRSAPPPPPPRHETALTEAEIRALFNAQRVDAATRAAFGEHAASPAGRYQAFTHAYVEAWTAAYAQTRDEAQALEAAVSARGVTEVVASGLSAVSPEALRAALGRKP